MPVKMAVACGGDAAMADARRSSASSQLARRKSSLRLSRTSGYSDHFGLPTNLFGGLAADAQKPWL